MAKYTATIKTLLDAGIELFDFDYTLSSSRTKQAIEQQFKDHYYLKEIGAETVERFKHYLKVRWLEALETYNALWDKYDIHAICPTTEYNETIANDNTYKEYPQSQIGTGYATNATIGNSTRKGSNRSEISMLEEYRKNIKDIDELFISEFENLFMGVL